MGLESMSNRMMRVARQELFFKQHHTLDEIIDSVEQVSADQILDVASEIFNPESFSQIVLLPANQ